MEVVSDSQFHAEITHVYESVLILVLMEVVSDVYESTHVYKVPAS